MTPILLTASVDTRGMKGALFSSIEREKMYVDTLNYYIADLGKRKGEYSLIFAENSGWNPESVKSKLGHADNVKVEYEALKPELFDQSMGKSYNEMLILDIVSQRNKTIQEAGWFFKLTGRYPILNLYRMLNEVQKHNRGGEMQLYADCKDHSLYDRLHIPWEGHNGETRYIAIGMKFYDKYIRGRYKELNDYKGAIVEKFFLKLIREHKHEPGVYGRFRTQVHLTGKGAHVGHKVLGHDPTDYDSMGEKVKRGVRQLLRWVMPWFCV